MEKSNIKEWCSGIGVYWAFIRVWSCVRGSPIAGNLHICCSSVSILLRRFDLACILLSLTWCYLMPIMLIWFMIDYFKPHKILHWALESYTIKMHGASILSALLLLVISCQNKNHSKFNFNICGEQVWRQTTQFILFEVLSQLLLLVQPML